MFKGLRQLFNNSSESLSEFLSSTETIISEDENSESMLNPSEGDTVKSPPTSMEDNVQKTNATENSVVGAENNGAMKYDPGTTELEGLKIFRKYHRGNLT